MDDVVIGVVSVVTLGATAGDNAPAFRKMSSEPPVVEFEGLVPGLELSSDCLGDRRDAESVLSFDGLAGGGILILGRSMVMAECAVGT